jgi:hypothetical protein
MHGSEWDCYCRGINRQWIVEPDSAVRSVCAILSRPGISSIGKAFLSVVKDNLVASRINFTASCVVPWKLGQRRPNIGISNDRVLVKCLRTIHNLVLIILAILTCILTERLWWNPATKIKDHPRVRWVGYQEGLHPHLHRSYQVQVHRERCTGTPDPNQKQNHARKDNRSSLNHCHPATEHHTLPNAICIHKSF